MTTNNPGHGASISDLRLMDMGFRPFRFTGSEDGNALTEHTYSLIRLLHEWPERGGYAILAYRLRGAIRGDMYLLTDNPYVGPPSAEQLLDLYGIPSFGAQHTSYLQNDVLGIHALWTYARELLESRTVANIDAAIYRAIATVARADMINWPELKWQIECTLENWDEDEYPLSAFCPEGFDNRVEALGDHDDDVPMRDGRMPRNQEYPAVLEVFLQAYDAAMKANTFDQEVED